MAGRTFDHVFIEDEGEKIEYTFDEFMSLPVDRRIKHLLHGQPKFWRDGAVISKREALGRA